MSEVFTILISSLCVKTDKSMYELFQGQPTIYWSHKHYEQRLRELKMGFSNLRDSGICAMNNFEFWRQISLLLFVVCF